MFIVSSGGCPILGSYCVIVERMFSLQDHSETLNLLPMMQIEIGIRQPSCTHYIRQLYSYLKNLGI